MEVSKYYLLVKVKFQSWTRSVQLLFGNQIITKILGQQLHNQPADNYTEEWNE